MYLIFISFTNRTFAWQGGNFQHPEVISTSGLVNKFCEYLYCIALDNLGFLQWFNKEIAKIQFTMLIICGIYSDYHVGRDINNLLPFARLINRFSKKKLRLGKWTILGPKMAHPHSSRSAVRIFLNFAQWKGPIGRWK